jgi:hypothetical protein
MTLNALILLFISLSLLSIKAPESPVPDLIIASGELNYKHSGRKLFNFIGN